VPHGPYIQVRLRPIKFLLRHFPYSCIVASKITN
jgi:hypothetical protein